MNFKLRGYNEDEVFRGIYRTSASQAIIAKKGVIRRHHLAHFEITDCHGAAESILHLLSKELLAGLDSFMIPPYEFIKKRRTRGGTLVEHQTRVANGGLVRVHYARVEESEEGFVPDIILESDSKSLIVEVAVNQKVDTIERQTNFIVCMAATPLFKRA